MNNANIHQSKVLAPVLKSAKTLGRPLFNTYNIILYFILILAVFANYPYIMTLAIPNVLQEAPSAVPNHPPVANAGVDQTANENSTVLLYGLASDPDPNDFGKLKYLWKQISGPEVKLNNNTSPNPSFIAPAVSSDREVRFSVTASDENGATSQPAFVIVTIKNVNRSPMTKAGEDQTVSPGDVVTLDGTKSSDPDNEPLRYSWIQKSGPKIKLDGATSSIASFTVPSNISSDMAVVFALTVSDSKNASSKDSVNVTVKYLPPPNKQPVANAGNDQTVNSGDIVTLDGNGSKDPDGKIVSYSWKQSSGPSVGVNYVNTPPTFTAPIVSNDTELKFSLIVTDDKGSSSSPAIVTIAVKAAVQASQPRISSEVNATIFENKTSITNGSSNQTHPQASTEYSFVTKWGSTGTGDGQFDQIYGVAVDSSGNVYVADTYNHRIQKFDSNGNFITKWGSAGDGDGQFDRPYGIAVDSFGYVYVSNFGHHRIQKFDSNGNFITKWGSNGTGDGQFQGPYGIALDSSGNVYIADYGNDRIQKFAPSD